jgi:hypothetical protein
LAFFRHDSLGIFYFFRVHNFFSMLAYFLNKLAKANFKFWQHVTLLNFFFLLWNGHSSFVYLSSIIFFNNFLGLGNVNYITIRIEAATINQSPSLLYR